MPIVPREAGETAAPSRFEERPAPAELPQLVRRLHGTLERISAVTREAVEMRRQLFGADEGVYGLIIAPLEHNGSLAEKLRLAIAGLEYQAGYLEKTLASLRNFA